MTERKKVVLITVTLIVVTALLMCYGADSRVLEQRGDYHDDLQAFETKMARADKALAAYEAQPIDLSVLDDIEAKQQAVIDDSNTLLSIDTDTYRGAVTYNKTIEGYAAHMRALNDVIAGASKTYDDAPDAKINAVPLPPSGAFGQTIGERLGIFPMPELGPSQEIQDEAAKLRERYREIATVREEWNTRAAAINDTQDDINDMRDRILDLYGTEDEDGVYIEQGSRLGAS